MKGLVWWDPILHCFRFRISQWICLLFPDQLAPAFKCVSDHGIMSPTQPPPPLTIPNVFPWSACIYSSEVVSHHSITSDSPSQVFCDEPRSIEEWKAMLFMEIVEFNSRPQWVVCCRVLCVAFWSNQHHPVFVRLSCLDELKRSKMCQTRTELTDTVVVYLRQEGTLL